MVSISYYAAASMFYLWLISVTTICTIHKVYNLSSEVDLDFARAAVENGEMKAIGQAVWIKQVEYLD